MPDLSFHITGVEPMSATVTPQLAFQLRIGNGTSREPIHAIVLRVQIQLEATRRRYDAGEQHRLFDLFGPPADWSRTLRRLLWTQTQLSIPAFDGQTQVELPVPCTYDLNVASTRYFDALAGGDVPLRFLFSGSVFYAGPHGLQVGQIPWEKEVLFRLPVARWRELMEGFYPHSAWLCLRKELVERLVEHKRRGGFSTWEQAVEHLLDTAEERITP